MKAVAALSATMDERGGTRIQRLRSAAPLVLRETPSGVFMVGGAAGPLGGDDLELEIDVGTGGALPIRSSAAVLALPGKGPARLHVSATVGCGGCLDWRPEPVILARGCDYRMSARITLVAGARLVWREEFILGRDGERPGCMNSRVDLEFDGRPLLRQALRLGHDDDEWSSPAVGGGHRCAGSLLVCDPAWADEAPVPVVLGPTAVLMPLSGPAVQVLAVADDARALRSLLNHGLAAVSAA
jgi:urease accessory protein